MIESIGVVGGGQLGRMLTEAAQPLGFKVTVLDSTPNCPASQVGANQIVGGITDGEAITRLAQSVDVVTWEIEHINAQALFDLENQGHDVQPSPTTLITLQDKYKQKQMLRQAGLPVGGFDIFPGDVTNESDRRLALDILFKDFQSPIMVKTRSGGYDGRGNYVFDGDFDALSQKLGDDWNNLYVEDMMPFDKELSVVAARDRKGNVTSYPVVETVHADNICNMVMSPADISPKLAAEAREVGHETLKLLGGAGVFAVEMFAIGDAIAINEIAPRVHNSGHHTIEANQTSQFEQHIRAITGMTLGSTELRAKAAVMINILGKRDEPLTREGLSDILALPDTHPHFYGKSSRPARKIGHITVLGETIKEAEAGAKQARRLLEV